MQPLAAAAGTTTVDAAAVAFGASVRSHDGRDPDPDDGTRFDPGAADLGDDLTTSVRHFGGGHSDRVREPVPAADFGDNDDVAPERNSDEQMDADEYPDREQSSSVALFEGDEGGLEYAQRRALVVLLKRRFVTASSHPKEWAALLANTRLIRSRLNDMFLELVLDREREVAYKRQVMPEGGGRFLTLLHDQPWGREETVLLVLLRTRHRAETAAGAGRAFIDRADILEHTAQHRPAHATDQSGDAKKATRAIDNLLSTGLLTGRSSGDRFEISNAIEVMLPVEKLTELLRWLQRQKRNAGDDDTAQAGADGPAEDDLQDGVLQ
jgi:hypothetical protein